VLVGAWQVYAVKKSELKAVQMGADGEEEEEDGGGNPLADAPAGFETAVVRVAIEKVGVDVLRERCVALDLFDAREAAS
jgi:hypothetical protein